MRTSTIMMLLFAAGAAAAQQATPATSGSSAFDAISAQVLALDADSSTEWSKVNIEALRQHLIDMNDLVLNAAVAQEAVPGGVRLTITGTGRTLQAIHRMLPEHMGQLEMSGEFTTKATMTADGAVVLVTAKSPSGDRAVARIRGLGFAGLMAVGQHHARHHMAMAKGDSAPHMH
jgi:hypothetical protein